ncbi:xylulokinase [Microbulbifer bruguierae]|uniref:Xylulose kinase n=1 Tax=Microbulbifer bruguierae TaxID=3029061 RepID=A0ABY8NB34_9GAMM|nr:xylulokinase [Microbulbifer bruguierae]WGL15792.1 xylulokinase [Microbulbifer bruguierae]
MTDFANTSQPGNVYLGIDAGTQSLKLLAYDANVKQILHVCSAPLELISRDDGSREQLAQWWLEALRRCVNELPAEIKTRVRGIGVSGQQHGFVPLNKAGEVIAPVKLWCDTSTIAECEEITERFGGVERCIDAVGNPILPGYTISKILWLKKNNPQAYAELAHILLPHDYLNFYLTGKIFSEFGDASGTGYLNILRREYDHEMLRALDPERDLLPLLPPLLPAHTTVALGEDARAEFGLPQGVRVSTGGGDNMMAAFGTGSVAPGVLTLSLGTSGTLFAHSDTPAIDPNGELAAFCASADGWLPLLCTMNCTVATEHSRKALGKSIAECEELLANSRPGADGLINLPFYNGERTPNLPHARASLHGMHDGNTTAANLYRAAMEGATFTLRRGLDAFARAGQQFSAIRLTGGGAKSPHWRQMVADVFNLPVEVPAQQEGAAFGAAMQALWACSESEISLRHLIDEHLAVDETLGCIPDANTVAAYQIHYQQFLELLQQQYPNNQ